MPQSLMSVWRNEDFHQRTRSRRGMALPKNEVALATTVRSTTGPSEAIASRRGGS